MRKVGKIGEWVTGIRDSSICRSLGFVFTGAAGITLLTGGYRGAVVALMALAATSFAGDLVLEVRSIHRQVRDAELHDKGVLTPGNYYLAPRSIAYTTATGVEVCHIAGGIVEHQDMPARPRWPEGR